MLMVMSKQPLGCILSWESVRPYPVYQMMCPFSLLLGDYNPHCVVFLLLHKSLANPLSRTSDCECTIKYFVHKHVI